MSLVADVLTNGRLATDEEVVALRPTKWWVKSPQFSWSRLRGAYPRLGPVMLQRPRLAVYNYSYYIDKDLLKEFEREFGVEVIYREFESGEEAYSALLRGGGGYDLVVVPDTYLKDVIAGGYVRKIDHGKLSNLGNVAPEFFENPNDRGLQYSIPYAFGITGFAVNYYAMCLWRMGTILAFTLAAMAESLPINSI